MNECELKEYRRLRKCLTYPAKFALQYAREWHEIKQLEGRSDIDIIIECEYEDIEIEGNLIDSGDKEFDQSCEAEVYDRLSRGDVWAWCRVKVTVQTDDDRSASDYLGGCNYKDQTDFKKSGYYLSMIHECLHQLEIEP